MTQLLTVKQCYSPYGKGAIAVASFIKNKYHFLVNNQEAMDLWLGIKNHCLNKNMNVFNLMGRIENSKTGKVGKTEAFFISVFLRQVKSFKEILKENKIPIKTLF